MNWKFDDKLLKILVVISRIGYFTLDKLKMRNILKE